MSKYFYVIPAKAGIQLAKRIWGLIMRSFKFQSTTINWIPACAGMTKQLKRSLIFGLIFQFLTVPLYPSLSISTVYAEDAFNQCLADGFGYETCNAQYGNQAPPVYEPEPEPPAPEPVYVPPPYVPVQQRYVPPPEPVYEPEYVQEIPYEEVPPAQIDPVAPQEQPVPEEVSLYQACLNSLAGQEVCDNLFGSTGPPIPGSLEPAEPVSPGEEPAQESGNWWDNLNPLSWTEPVQQWFEERVEEAGEIWDGTMEGARELASNIFGGGSKEPASTSEPGSIAAGPVPQDPAWSAKIAQAQTDWEAYKAQAEQENPEAAARLRSQTIASLGLPEGSTDAEVREFIEKKFESEGVKIAGSSADESVNVACLLDPSCMPATAAVEAPTLAAQIAGTADGGCDSQKAIRYIKNDSGETNAVLDMTCRPEVTDTQELLKLQAESDKALAEINKAKSSEATGNILDLAGQYLACNAVPIPLVDAAAAYFFESCRDANEKVAALGTGIATSIAASGTSRNEFYGNDEHNNDCKAVVAGFARSRPGSLAEATGMLETSGCYYDNRTNEQRERALKDTIDPENNPAPDMYAALAAAGLPYTGWRATKIKNLANELEFDLSKPNADPAKRDNFIARLIDSDPEAATAVIENVFSVPVTALQNERVARAICERYEGTASCDLGSLDPNTRLAQPVRAVGYYLDLSEDDAKGLNSDAAALFPNFQAADLEKVKQYVTARSNIVVPGVTADDEELRRIRTAEAMGLNIDDPEFKMIEETIAVWNSTSDQTLANSSAGRTLGEAKAEADTQGIIGALSLGLDSPDFLEVGIAGFLIARKALPKLVGKNGIRTIKEAEEFAIQNGWELADDGLMEAKRLELAQGQARPNAPEPAGPAPEVPARIADEGPTRTPGTEEIAEVPDAIAEIPAAARTPVAPNAPGAEPDPWYQRVWDGIFGNDEPAAPTPEVKPQQAEELAQGEARPGSNLEVARPRTEPAAPRSEEPVTVEPPVRTDAHPEPAEITAPRTGPEAPAQAPEPIAPKEPTPIRTEQQEPTSIRPQEETELPCAALLPIKFQLIKEVYAQDEGRRPCSIFNLGDWETMINRALGRAEPEPAPARVPDVPGANQADELAAKTDVPGATGPDAPTGRVEPTTDEIFRGGIPYGEEAPARIEAIIEATPHDELGEVDLSRFKGGNTQVDPGSGGSGATYWVSNDQKTFTKMFPATASEQEVKNEAAVVQLSSKADVGPTDVRVITKDDKAVGYSMENLDSSDMVKLRDKIDSLSLEQRLKVINALARYHDSVGRMQGDMYINWLDHTYVGENGRVVFIDPAERDATSRLFVTPKGEAQVVITGLLGKDGSIPNRGVYSTEDIARIEGYDDSFKALGNQILDDLDSGKSLREALYEAGYVDDLAGRTDAPGNVGIGPVSGGDEVVDSSGFRTDCLSSNFSGRFFAWATGPSILGISKGEVLAVQAGAPCPITAQVAKFVDKAPGFIKNPLIAVAETADNVVNSATSWTGPRVIEKSLIDDVVPNVKIDEIAKWRESQAQIDILSESLRKGEIDLPVFVQKVEELSGVNTPVAKTTEAALLIDNKFLSTSAITGGNAPEKLFGDSAWADWLNARTAAKSYDGELTVDFMKDLHLRLTTTTAPEIGGKLRTINVIGGDYTNLGSPVKYTEEQFNGIQSNPLLRFQQSGTDPFTGFIVYPQSNQVDGMLNDLTDWYKTQLKNPNHDPYELAADLQQRFISIHPFGDVNGRVSRLLMDWSLEREGLSPAWLVEPSNDLISSLSDWSVQVKNGSKRFEEIEKRRQLLDRIGYYDQSLLLGLGEERTFYNSVYQKLGGKAPEVSKPGDGLVHPEYDAFLIDLKAKKAEFDDLFSGTRTISDVVTEKPIDLSVGGLIPESYIKLIEQRPKDYDAYQKLMGQFYSDVQVYRGGVFAQQIKSNADVLKFFEQQTAVGSGYSALGYASPQSIVPISNANVTKSLRQYNDLITAQYLAYKTEVPHVDGLYEIIMVHTAGVDPNKLFSSPFASTSTDYYQSSGWARQFNQQAQTGILFSSKPPLDGSIFTFKDAYGSNGIKSFHNAPFPHPSELEVLIPGGIRPEAINSVTIYESDKGTTFSANRVIHNDQVFVVVKDGSGNMTDYELNPSSGRYELSSINIQQELGSSLLKTLPEKIDNAESLESLNTLFKEMETYNGGVSINGKKYSADDLSKVIEAYSHGYGSIYEIPKELGLRAKVKKIIDDENLTIHGYESVNGIFDKEYEKLNKNWKTAKKSAKDITIYLAPNGSVTQNKLSAPGGSYEIKATMVIDETGKAGFEKFSITEDTPEQVINPVKEAFKNYESLLIVPLDGIVLIPRKVTAFDRILAAMDKTGEFLVETIYHKVTKPVERLQIWVYGLINRIKPGSDASKTYNPASQLPFSNPTIGNFGKIYDQWIKSTKNK